MGDTRFPAAVVEKRRDWQTSAPAKRPRNEYEYDFSLSGVNVNRREDLGHAQRGGDRVGFRLLTAPPLTFLGDGDHRLWGDQADAPPFLEDHAPPAKRPRNGYEYDSSLSVVNANRREDLRYAERGGDRVGVRLLRDQADAPPFLEDHAPAKRPLNYYEYDGSLSGVNAPPFLDDHAPAKRPRNGYEYDSSLSGVNANRREDFRYAERGSDRVGIRLLRDRAHSPSTPPSFLDGHRLRKDQDQAHAPPFSDDHLLLRDQVHAPRSSGSGGLNFRSDPVIGGRRPVDDHFLPPDASGTLFVEGVPSNCTSREAAHIFRHFRGFKEVRIVNKFKEPQKAHGGEERDASDAVVVLCFVDFDNPKCAATAMASLQGYIFDDNDRDSPSLKLQFARSSNARKRDRNGSSFARDRNQDRDHEYRRRR